MYNTIAINTVYTNVRGQKVTERIVEVLTNGNTAEVCVGMVICEELGFETDEFFATIPVINFEAIRNF